MKMDVILALFGSHMVVKLEVIWRSLVVVVVTDPFNIHKFCTQPCLQWTIRRLYATRKSGYLPGVHQCHFNIDPFGPVTGDVICITHAISFWKSSGGH